MSHFVDIRRNAEVRRSDAIDILIADGDDNHTIIEVRATVLLLNYALIVHLIVCPVCYILWCPQYCHDLHVA
jgi:hypothetical protein